MQWPVGRSAERLAIRMHQMMDRLDVDPAVFVRLSDGQAYAEARARCLKCCGSADCLRWLDGYGSAPITPEFCPNFRIFRPYERRPRATQTPLA